MAYVKIIFQNSPSTATPINAQNLNHMDDQIALNDQRLTELEGAHVSSFNGRTGAVTPADRDYDIGQIAPLSGAQVGQVPVVTNIGTEEAPELVFRMGAGGGAGGHEIIDSEGNTMPQESAMQFADSHVSDDSTNGRTVVENVKEVTLAELSQATERGMYLATDEESVPIGASSEDKVEVVADGVKTYATLLNELYALIDATKLTNNSYIPIFDGYFRLSDATGGNFSFVREFSGAKLFSDTLYLSSASSKIRSWETTTSGSTYSESASSEKPSNGTVITLYYGTSSTVINLKTDANYCQYDSQTTVKDVIKKNALSITPSSGNTLSHNLVLTNGLVFGNIEIEASSNWTIGTWTQIAEISNYSASDIITNVAWDSSNGDYLGIIEIRTNGKIRIYSKISTKYCSAKF